MTSESMLQPALFNRKGRISSVLGKRFIYANVNGPTFISLGLPEEVPDHDSSPIKFSPFVIYKDGKPCPCEDFIGHFVFFDAYKLKDAGFVAAVVWTDCKPICVPFPIGDSYMICEVLEDVPIVHIDYEFSSLNFVHENILKQAAIELDGNADSLLKNFKASQFKGTIYVHGQKSIGQSLRYVCTSLKLTETIFYSPKRKFSPSQLYEFTENGIKEAPKGCYLHSNILGDIIYKNKSYVLNFSFKSNDFSLPVSPKTFDMQMKCEEVYLHIYEEMQVDGSLVLKVSMIAFPARYLAFSVDFPLKERQNEPYTDRNDQLPNSMCFNPNVHKSNSPAAAANLCDGQNHFQEPTNKHFIDPTKPPQYMKNNLVAKTSSSEFKEILQSLLKIPRHKYDYPSSKHYYFNLDLNCKSIVNVYGMNPETQIQEPTHDQPRLYLDHSRLQSSYNMNKWGIDRGCNPYSEPSQINVRKPFKTLNIAPKEQVNPNFDGGKPMCEHSRHPHIHQPLQSPINKIYSSQLELESSNLKKISLKPPLRLRRPFKTNNVDKDPLNSDLNEAKLTCEFQSAHDTLGSDFLDNGQAKTKNSSYSDFNKKDSIVKEVEIVKNKLCSPKKENMHDPHDCSNIKNEENEIYNDLPAGIKRLLLNTEQNLPSEARQDVKNEPSVLKKRKKRKKKKSKKNKKISKKINNINFEMLEIAELLDFLAGDSLCNVLNSLSNEELDSFQFPNLLCCSRIESNLWGKNEDLHKPISACHSNYLRNWSGVLVLINNVLYLEFSVNKWCHFVELKENCLVIMDNNVIYSAQKAFKDRIKNVKFDAYRLASETRYQEIVLWIDKKPKHATVTEGKSENHWFDVFGIVSKMFNGCLEITCRYPIKRTLWYPYSTIYNGFDFSKLTFKDHLGALVLVNFAMDESNEPKVTSMIHLTHTIRSCLFFNS